MYNSSQSKDDRALQAFSDLLGPNSLNYEDEITSLASMSCNSFDSSPLAVAFPKSVTEVKGILEIAKSYDIKVHPVSTGKNWGYGSSCATEDNFLILNLSRMNRIIEINEELAYAVIEPGVTQEQLYQFLSANCSRVIMDATGASPEASILGNLLERGFGQTNYGDKFLHFACLEVVMPDGSLLKTGFGHYDSPNKFLHKWGIGPSLDGIFSQSNFGIVVRAGIWLMRKPESAGVFIAGTDDDFGLSQMVEQLREMKLEGRLPATVHIANDLRVISALQQAPEHSASVSEAQLKLLRKKWQLHKWNCIASVMGSRKEVKLRAKELKKRLRQVAKCSFIGDRLAKIIRPLAPMINYISGRNINRQLSIIELMKGRPTWAPTRSTYWRKSPLKEGQISLDPPRDRCGVIWCSPVFPSTAESTILLLRVVDKACCEFELESNISITLVSERACCATIGIFFDKEDSLQCSRATSCHHLLLDLLAAEGFMPYRFGIDVAYSQKHIFKDDIFWRTCRLLKKTLDPYNIISPGKYSIVPE